MNLTRSAEILRWPFGELDKLQLSLWFRAWRTVFCIGVEALLGGALEQEASATGGAPSKSWPRVRGNGCRQRCARRIAGTGNRGPTARVGGENWGVVQTSGPKHRVTDGRFAIDSPLEGTGFELSVPREIGFVSRLCRSSADLSCGELRAPISEAACSTTDKPPHPV